MNWQDAVRKSLSQLATRVDPITNTRYYRRWDGSAYSVRDGRYDYHLPWLKLEGFLDWEPVNPVAAERSEAPAKPGTPGERRTEEGTR